MAKRKAVRGVKTQTKVMRIPIDVYERIKELKGDQSYGTFLLATIEFAEHTSNRFYVSEGRLFTELLDARGEAIMQAVKAKRQPVPVSIAVIVGEDQL